MENLVQFILALFLFNCLFLAASSRMLHLIRLVSIQGLLLGILPLVAGLGVLHLEHCVLGFVNISVKAALLPYLLYVAMKKASVQRELEPIIGYSLSAFAVLCFCGGSFWIAMQLHLPTPLSTTAVATALTLLLTGLFLVAARKKALTQVIGFLTFENGIALFGIGIMKHHPFLVEMGILLDVFVLVFIMGIAICQIKREFSHIDADKLSSLDDLPEKNVSANVMTDKEAAK